MADIHTMPLPEFLETHTSGPGNIISLKKETTGDPVSRSDEVTPVDLLGKFPVPLLPEGLLPRRIEDFARTMATQMGADPSGLAMGALLACAAAIPDTVALQVKEHDTTWLECARIWVLLIGAPSSMKSPTIKAATRPLYGVDSGRGQDRITRISVAAAS